MIEYTETQIIFIKELRLSGCSWGVVQSKYNNKFKTDKTHRALRDALRRYGDMYELESNQQFISNLVDTRRTKRTASRMQLQNVKLIEHISAQEEVLDAVQQAASSIVVKRPQNIKMSSSDESKHLMTIELLLSDLHYGKRTDKFNAEIARDRMRELTRIFIREYNDQRRVFDVEKIIIAMIGDIIESYTMHGLESATACEMTNSEQIMLSITSLFEDVLMPIANLGVPITVPCVTGNHDRTDREKTYNWAGRSNVTWIIYNALSVLCATAGFKHVTFHIAEHNYLLLSIYNNTCLYEHGDHCKSTNKNVLEAHIAARSKQLNKMIDFMRLGHWHEVTMYEQGRIIVNGSLPGQDSYADTKGYNSQAFQVINYYIETETRPNCFYKSFPVYLG